MRRAFLPFTLLILSAATLQAGVATVPVVRLTLEAEIAAPPETVWKHLTTGKNLVTWCPVWKSETNASVVLTKVGDSLDFTDAWGNGGRSVVTFLAAGKELRVTHEPNDGSYLCASRVTIAAAGKGTRLTWVEQYTDESAEADRNATAAKMTEDMQASIEALKQGVEP